MKNMATALKTIRTCKKLLLKIIFFTKTFLEEWKVDLAKQIK